jgi:DNA-directed RNA polymerase specialized sigma24 family protein
MSEQFLAATPAELDPALPLINASQTSRINDSGSSLTANTDQMINQDVIVPSTVMKQATMTQFGQDLVAAEPLIRRIVQQRLNSFHRQSAEDIAQRVLLNLWQWRNRYSEREISPVELQKIGARSARRAVQLYYRQQNKQSMRNIIHTADFASSINKTEEDCYNQPEDGPSENNLCHDERDTPRIDAETASCTASTAMEVASLAKFLFRQILELSGRQRFALLLQKSELIVHLITNKACLIPELADALALTKTEFLTIVRRLPLSDEEIGELWTAEKGEALCSKQVREARCRARLRIREALAELEKPK